MEIELKEDGYRFEVILEKIIILLNKHERYPWADCMSVFLEDFKSGLKEKIARKILNAYEGLGSFNSIMLRDKSGNVVKESQDGFDELRKELYEHCAAYAGRCKRINYHQCMLISLNKEIEHQILFLIIEITVAYFLIKTVMDSDNNPLIFACIIGIFIILGFCVSHFLIINERISDYFKISRINQNIIRK